MENKEVCKWKSRQFSLGDAVNSLIITECGKCLKMPLLFVENFNWTYCSACARQIEISNEEK